MSSSVHQETGKLRARITAKLICLKKKENIIGFFYFLFFFRKILDEPLLCQVIKPKTRCYMWAQCLLPAAERALLLTSRAVVPCLLLLSHMPYLELNLHFPATGKHSYGENILHIWFHRHERVKTSLRTVHITPTAATNVTSKCHTRRKTALNGFYSGMKPAD